MSLYDYCFDILGFNEVHNEVFKLNEGVWKLHIACGCKIIEKIPEKIEKEGVRYDVVSLSMEKDEWYKLRKNKKYEKINYDIFQNIIDGGVVHHLGIAVVDLMKSIREYQGLGWTWDGEIVEDNARSVNLAFLKHDAPGGMLELICPTSKRSPVSNILESRRNVATPYHICYEVCNIEKIIHILKRRKYTLTDALKPAVAFGNRRVAFMLSRNSGLIELLEEKRKEV